ncbi:uncharacterized protein LOC106172572 [Lingula anatina]|uniref:Uncharacterized protein LOC106172572 n=1 Tax=Lingula anatina TaxID=7574 RepID=A0A1S3JFY0_LINAN|nr:uncharacterized protein LOC106172572 [Lingula anatina]|eukprot:XP_013408804.1 uncharacterized protein LOC106172572 [Lingula anatina]
MDSCGEERRHFILMCRLLLDCGTEAVREVFDKIHPPVTLPVILFRNKCHLLRLRTKHVLTKPQWTKLYPATNTFGQSKDFDITLLFILLRNVCNLSPPANGWDQLPKAGDTGVVDDLARLKWCRNHLYAHVESSKLPETSFNTYFPVIQQAILRLGGPHWQSKILALETDPLTENEETYLNVIRDWYKQDQEAKIMLERLHQQGENLAMTVQKQSDQIAELATRVEEILVEVKGPIDASKSPINGQSYMYELTCPPANSLASRPRWWAKVAEILKDLYLDLFTDIQPLPWLDEFKFQFYEVYTDLEIKRKYRSGPSGEREEDLTEASNMFARESSGRQPCRVRVEGEPGVGKTLYCHKVAYDWARGLYPQFELVFLLECKNMRNSLVETCFDQLLPEDLLMQLGYTQTIDYKEVLEELAKHQEHVLFIFDAYDELPEHKKSDILNFDVDKVVHSKLLRKSTVLITSRPYECNEDLKACEVFYSINGFSETNRDAYVLKHFQDDPKSGQNLLQKLSEQRNVSEISCNPLNLVLLCLVWSVHQRSLPDTISRLYWEISVYIIKRYCERNKIEMSDENIPEKVLPLLQKLGKLAYDGLCDNDTMSFSVADIRRGYYNVQFIELGFMKKERSYSKTFEYTTCSFLHRTFQEALCAWYVSLQSAPNDTFFVRCASGPSNRLLSRFVAGFMAEKSQPLFNALAQAVQTIDAPTESEKLIRIMRAELTKLVYEKLMKKNESAEWLDFLHSVDADRLFQSMVKAGMLQTICECFYECNRYNFLDCFSCSFWEILTLPINMTYEFEQGLRKVLEYQDKLPQQVPKIINVVCGQSDGVCDTLSYACAQTSYFKRVKQIITGCRSVETLALGLSGAKVVDGLATLANLICEVISSLPNLQKLCLTRLDDTVGMGDRCSTPLFDYCILGPVFNTFSNNQSTVRALEVKGHFKQVPLEFLKNAKNIETLSISLNGEETEEKRPFCSCLPWPYKMERVSRDFIPELCSFMLGAEPIKKLDVTFRNCTVDLKEFCRLCKTKETFDHLSMSFGKDVTVTEGSWQELSALLQSPESNLLGFKLDLGRQSLDESSVLILLLPLQHPPPFQEVELYGIEGFGHNASPVLSAIKVLVEQNRDLQSLVVGFGGHNGERDDEIPDSITTAILETLAAISESHSLNRFEMIGWENIPGLGNRIKTLITAVTNLIKSSKSIQRLAVSFLSRGRGIIYGSSDVASHNVGEENGIRHILQAVAQRNRTLVSLELSGWDVIYGGGTADFVSDLTDIIKQNRVLRKISVQFLQKESVLFHEASAKALLAALPKDDALESFVLDGLVVSPKVLALFKEFQRPKSLKNAEFKLIAESGENSTFDEAVQSLSDSVIQMFL